ncbi:DSBA-like thioredoxin family protein [Desulfosporosinus metallidurans]|uniref:DSBA-like thioredoxin family protein n=2 Tax=Desulfosporosinus metallidurans TaxID=1888891 RepID=A0A1Q8QL64_9FIRM|nr:DSBA-like thioredoxin family protein [Desulfosporosinus metallidurans]
MYKNLNEMGAIYGLKFTAHDLLSNSRPSILLGEYIHLHYPAQEDAYHASVFSAYFSEGKDIGQSKILADLLQKLGIDSNVLANALNDPACQIRMKENAQSSAAMQVTGTPTFFIGNERIVGAQPYPRLLAVARRALGLDDTNQNDF